MSTLNLTNNNSWTTTSNINQENVANVDVGKRNMTDEEIQQQYNGLYCQREEIAIGTSRFVWKWEKFDLANRIVTVSNYTPCYYCNCDVYEPYPGALVPYCGECQRHKDGEY